MTNSDNLAWNEKHPDLFVRLYAVLKGMTLEEEIRLIKIILELLRINGIPLEFLETLFLAMDEANVGEDAPEELLALETDFSTISCDIKHKRISFEEFIQKIENTLANLQKKK